MNYYKNELGYIRSELELPYDAISQSEYESGIAVIALKLDYVKKVLNDEINETDVPIDYRSEVMAEVEAIREVEASPPDDNVSIEDALNILLGGE